MTDAHDQMHTTITDDRGVVRPLWKPESRPLIRTGAMQSHGSRWRIALFAALALVGMGLRVASGWDRYHLGMFDLLFGATLLLLSVLVVSVAAMLLDRRATLRRKSETPAQRAKRLMLGLGRCPSCDTPLNARTDPDGCHVCPSCAGAWKRVEDLPPTLSGAHDLARCDGCGYSLRDLPLHDDGRLICPECGWSRVADAVAWKLSPRCWNRKRSLRGLPLVNGDRVQCPDCGQWRSGLTDADVGVDEQPPGAMLVEGGSHVEPAADA